jgi:hypothetical protein
VGCGGVDWIGLAQDRAGHEISGLNPVARSESLAVIFSRTDLIQKKPENKLEAYRQTKIFGRRWRPEISRPGIETGGGQL